MTNSNNEQQDLIGQLQAMVDSGEMTPEEAEAYLQQTTTPQDDVVSQLQAMVDAGEITPEEAQAYMEQSTQPTQSQDFTAQLQAMVESGEITPEEAQAYLEQVNQATQPAPAQDDVVAQLQAMVEAGEITPEEAQVYMQKMQQPQQEQEQPQMTAEQAVAEIEQAVANGQITPEEAQTYLQQMFGANVTSQPHESYTGKLKDKVSPEEYLTGEVTSGDDTKPYNAEVEAGEYLNRNGLTQKVVGNKHSRGGEKMNLEEGTIIISDSERIGAANARALSIQTGMKLKAGDTYAQVIDIFNKKIGLDKLNKEQEDLFSQLRKSVGKGSETTQNLNQDFLNGKIKAIEEKKLELLSAREQLTKVLFDLQEEGKARKKATKQGEVPEYADGGKTPPENPWWNPTDLARIKGVNYGSFQIVNDKANAFDDRPKYVFDQRYGLDSLEALNRFGRDFGLQRTLDIGATADEFNAYAGEAQKAVPTELAEYYGYAALPTQQGLQFLLDKGYVPMSKLGDIVDKKTGKVKRGLTGADEKIINDIAKDVEALEEGKKKEYGKINFQDNKWFYRRPVTETFYFDNRDEYDKVNNSFTKVGGYLAGPKHGYFAKTKLLQIKKFKTQEELDAWREKYKDKADEKHTDFLDDGTQENTYFKGVVEGSPEEKKEEDKLKATSNPARNKNNFGPIMLPDQSTLAPEPLRSVPHRQIRLQYLDRAQTSPEATIAENNRAYLTALGRMEGIPDVVAGANAAMLAGNIADANNKAWVQANQMNQQENSRIDSANNQMMNAQIQADANFSDLYDQRMNKAMDTTRRDYEGFFDFNRKVAIENWKTRNQIENLQRMMNYVKLDANGNVVVDADGKDVVGEYENSPAAIVNAMTDAQKVAAQKAAASKKNTNNAFSGTFAKSRT